MSDSAPEQFEPQHKQSDAHRGASVTLRAESEGRNDQLEVANQSLRDALRITYRLLQLGIVVVALLYLFSGAQVIRESERGVATVFGRIVETNLEPGLRLGFPYPVGELIRVDTGSIVLEESQAFWPSASRAGDSIEDIPDDFERWSGVEARGARRLAEKIAKHRARALKTKELATVVRNVPGMTPGLTELAYRGANRERTEELFERLGWNRIRDRIPKWQS